MATYFTVAAINSLQLSCSFCRSVTLKSEGCMRYNHNHRSLVILFHWHIFPKLPPSLPSWPQKARQPISVAVQHGYHSAMWNVPASTGPKWWNSILEVPFKAIRVLPGFESRKWPTPRKSGPHHTPGHRRASPENLRHGTHPQLQHLVETKIIN